MLLVRCLIPGFNSSINAACGFLSLPSAPRGRPRAYRRYVALHRQDGICSRSGRFAHRLRACGIAKAGIQMNWRFSHDLDHHGLRRERKGLRFRIPACGTDLKDGLFLLRIGATEYKSLRHISGLVTQIELRAWVDSDGFPLHRWPGATRRNAGP